MSDTTGFTSPYPEWRLMRSKTVRRSPCAHCGVLSSWHPQDWIFRHRSVRGQGIHGPKVRTEHLCPECRKVLGVEPSHV